MLSLLNLMTEKHSQEFYFWYLYIERKNMQSVRNNSSQQTTTLILQWYTPTPHSFITRELLLAYLNMRKHDCMQLFEVVLSFTHLMQDLFHTTHLNVKPINSRG